MQQTQPDFAKSERLIRFLAMKFHRRAVAAGAASVQLEDIFQEMCVAWCKARDSWRPESQVPFSAYLSRGIRNELNRWIGKQIVHAHDKIDLDDAGDADGEMDDYHNVIADASAVSPEDATIDADHRAKQRELLSAGARKFLELLDSPPPALYAIITAQGAKRRFAQARGLAPGFVATHIRAPLIFDLMGCDQRARATIRRELQLYANLENAIND